jgi:hypothetical protein
MKWTVEFTREEVCEKLKEMALETIKQPNVRIDFVDLHNYGRSKVTLTNETETKEE